MIDIMFESNVIHGGDNDLKKNKKNKTKQNKIEVSRIRICCVAFPVEKLSPP